MDKVKKKEFLLCCEVWNAIIKEECVMCVISGLFGDAGMGGSIQRLFSLSSKYVLLQVHFGIKHCNHVYQN